LHDGWWIPPLIEWIAMNILTKVLHLGGSVEPVRFAVIGLGNFAQTAILPAFANASDKASLAAVVTGDIEKAAKLSRKYKVPAHHYDFYDELLESGNIDAVYIALPNSKHRDYTERAAKAGVHVLCEKPLAYTAKDAAAMIAACRKAKVRLMTAYRLHFEEGNLQAIKAVEAGKIGEARVFTSTHTMQVDPDNVRVDVSLGGGPLEDIGIYCINAARYLFRAEPTEVFAMAVHGTDKRFEEVPETVIATMRFSGGRMASFVCGFGQTKISEYRIVGTEGMLTMKQAYSWHDDIEQTLERDGKLKAKRFKHRDQVAAELAYFADCVRKGRDPEPSGHEGLIDVQIIEALRTSYEKGKPIASKIPQKRRRPTVRQSIRRGPARKTRPVKAPSPSKG
jgi:glucose-fructose oxidoreductase